MSDRMAARNLHEAIILAREIKSSIEKKRRNLINGRVDNTCIPDVSFVVLDLIAAEQSYRDTNLRPGLLSSPRAG